MNHLDLDMTTILSAGQYLSHGVLAACSVLLTAALAERTLFLALRRPNSPRPLLRQARGLYGLLAWVGGIAPMAGLLGTVTGIMQSFAGGRGGGLDQQQLMQGIGFALTATAVGLLLAMGAFSGRAVFARRTEELAAQAARRVS
jgi:hypothetical protein